MTYSFSAKGLCKVDALLDLDDKVDKTKSLNESDRNLILMHAREVVATIGMPEYTEQVVISCHGYSTKADERTTSAYCAIAAHIVAKK